jgi:hypothetical protein
LASGLPYQLPPMPRTESFSPPAGPPGNDRRDRLDRLDRPDNVESAPDAAATLSESWSELMPDVFVLPAAVEAAQATADEGPGPWPPVVADDPVDAPPLVPKATAATPAIPPRNQPQPLQALKRLLRQIRVVSEYRAE